MPNINLCSPVRRVVAPTKNCTGKIASGANFRAAWCLIDKCTVIDFSCLDLCARRVIQDKSSFLLSCEFHLFLAHAATLDNSSVAVVFQQQPASGMR